MHRRLARIAIAVVALLIGGCASDNPGRTSTAQSSKPPEVPVVLRPVENRLVDLGYERKVEERGLGTFEGVAPDASVELNFVYHHGDATNPSGSAPVGIFFMEFRRSTGTRRATQRAIAFARALGMDDPIVDGSLWYMGRPFTRPNSRRDLGAWTPDDRHLVLILRSVRTPPEPTSMLAFVRSITEDIAPR
jgi:hypothetical protein